jgi:putrescine transport system permease protein
MSRRARLLILGPPLIWLVLFFLVPFLIIFRISLSEPVTAVPPYAPLFDLAGGLGGLAAAFAELDFETYRALLDDDLYLVAFLTSVRIAAGATAILAVVGYPLALAMTRAPTRWKPYLVLMVVLPFWTSFLIRVYAWIGILKEDGFLNAALIKLGLIRTPLPLLNNDFAVHVGIVYVYLPFMVLPLYAVLDRLDDDLLEAAADLGAPPWRAFLAVTLPLSLPGVAAGSLLVFIPAMGEVVIPELLGGTETLMFGKLIWNEFFANRDWPRASAVAIVLLAVLVIPIVAAHRMNARSLEVR